jgi:hypothetical protein
MVNATKFILTAPILKNFNKEQILATTPLMAAILQDAMYNKKNITVIRNTMVENFIIPVDNVIGH